MTDEQINTLIAERIMGWTLSRGGVPYWMDESKTLKMVMEAAYWYPMVRMEHAWMAVEKMVEQGFYVTVEAPRWGKGWRVLIYSRDVNPRLSEADTASAAICLAVLKFMGVEVDRP